MTTRGWAVAVSAVFSIGLFACGETSQAPVFVPVAGITGKLASTTVVDRSGYSEYPLYILDLQTGAKRTIYTSSSRGEGIFPVAWHPNGQSLIVQGFSFNTGFRLYRLSEDGTRFGRVFGTDSEEHAPAYSLQGKLAFCAHVRSSNPSGPATEGLFVDGVLRWPNLCPITAGISWFPNGSAVVLTTSVAGIEGLYRVDLATQTATLLLATPPLAVFFSPAVSPQGDVIALTVAEGTAAEVWLLQADGSDPSPLLSGAGPQWSPDASRLMFSRGGSLYVRELATGTEEKIGEFGGGAWYP